MSDREFGEHVVRMFLDEYAENGDERGDMERGARFVLGFLGILPDDEGE